MDNITAVEIPDQNMVMVAINVTVHNSGEKSLWIHDIKGKIATDSGELSDEAASAVDFDRYFQAFPAAQGARPGAPAARDENPSRRPGPRHDRGDFSRDPGRLRQAQVPERGNSALRSAPAAGADEIRKSPPIHTDFHGFYFLGSIREIRANPWPVLRLLALLHEFSVRQVSSGGGLDLVVLQATDGAIDFEDREGHVGQTCNAMLPQRLV